MSTHDVSEYMLIYSRHAIRLVKLGDAKGAGGAAAIAARRYRWFIEDTAAGLERDRA